MKKFAVISSNNLCVVSNDEYLDMLTTVFTDRLSFAKNIKKNLESPHGTGMSGNEIWITVEDQEIMIRYLYAVDEYIIINRQTLIKILEKGIALLGAQTNYIVLSQEHENSPIEVSDQLPVGMQLYTEGTRLKYTFSNQETKKN